MVKTKTLVSPAVKSSLSTLVIFRTYFSICREVKSYGQKENPQIQIYFKYTFYF